MENEIALIGEDGSLNRIAFARMIDPTAKVRKGWSWVPVVREEGAEAFEGVVDGSYVIRTVRPAEPVPPPVTISTYTIVKRIEAAGKSEEASHALDLQPALKFRFLTVGSIRLDDPIARDMITALGLNPDVILAPVVL